MAHNRENRRDKKNKKKIIIVIFCFNKVKKKSQKTNAIKHYFKFENYN